MRRRQKLAPLDDPASHRTTRSRRAGQPTDRASRPAPARAAGAQRRLRLRGRLRARLDRDRRSHRRPGRDDGSAASAAGGAAPAAIEGDIERPGVKAAFERSEFPPAAIAVPAGDSVRPDLSLLAAALGVALIAAALRRELRRG